DQFHFRCEVSCFEDRIREEYRYKNDIHEVEHPFRIWHKPLPKVESNQDHLGEDEVDGKPSGLRNRSCSVRALLRIHPSLPVQHEAIEASAHKLVFTITRFEAPD